MRLLELQIRRLPGIERPYGLDAAQLGRGVHVVFGPNGIGKSSILRALRALWWPAELPGHAVDVRARFEHEGSQWLAERDGSSVVWQRDRARSAAPILPEAHLASSTLIGLAELDGQGDDSWFTVRVRRAMADGYEIRALLPEEGARLGHNQARAWAEARQRVGELEGEQRKLQLAQRGLAELEVDLAAASAAGELQQRLEVARELVGLRVQHKGVELRLQSFPAGMAGLPGDAAGRLEELDQARARLATRCAAYQREIAQAAEARRASGLEQALSAGELEEQRERVQRLTHAEEALDQLALQLAELEARSSGSPPDGGEDPQAQAQAIRSLRAWLAAPAVEPAGALRFLPHLVAALAAVALGALVHAGWLALLVPVALDLALRARRRSPRTGRDEWRAQFERTGLAAPSTWEVPAVELSLSALEERQAGTRELAQAAASELRAKRARRAELERQRDELADGVSAWLASHGADPTGDARDLGRVLAELAERSRRWEQARADGARAEGDLAERESELRDVDRSIQRLFEALGLGSDQRPELEQWIERRDEWADLAKQAANLGESIARLAPQAAGLEGLAEATLEDLDRRLVAARDRAQQRDALLERRSAIRERLEATSRSTELEQARAAEETQRGEFQAAWEQACRGLAKRLLIEDVERVHETTSRPAVLERARQLFADFTHGRYTLDVRDEDGRAVLRAEDAARPGRGVELAALSDGTRAQLLLAARLAHIGQAEGGARLPLFLDDALATSDAGRTRAVAEGLFALAAAEGRQVFVLVRDESDAALVAAAGEGARVIDLAALRAQASALTDRARLTPPERVEVPSPAGRDPAEWARALGVAPIDPWRDVDDAHLYWLLVDEPQLLHRLLVWRFERWGPTRSQIERGRAPFLAADEVARLRTWARVFQVTLEGWRVGRGRPVQREALLAADVSDKYLEVLLDMARERGGDAKALLEAVEKREDDRVKGFRGSVLERLEAELEARGHLDRNAPLDLESAWSRVLARLADLDELEPAALRARFEFLRARFDEALLP